MCVLGRALLRRDRQVERAWARLADAEEFGLGPLLQQVARVCIDAFEVPESDAAAIGVDYAYVGMYATRVTHLKAKADDLVDLAGKLGAFVETLGEAALHDGEVQDAPTCGEYGVR